MAESLTDFLAKQDIGVRYMHSEIDTLERVEIVSGLKKGEFDVLVGINLLREGLDMPQVKLVAILDADKEGFLRSDTALIHNWTCCTQQRRKGDNVRRRHHRQHETCNRRNKPSSQN